MLVDVDEVRRALGLDPDAFDDDRAEEAVEQVDALARVYADPERVAGLEQSSDATDKARLEALRQVVKQYAVRVYNNPEGVLQRQIHNAGSVSYADTSEAAHGLNRNLRRAVRSAVGGSRMSTPLYASERDES